MGWNSANAIVDPQIALMVKAVENGELSEPFATKMLVELIGRCQDGDWDTEDESLGDFIHVPWVVRAFKEKGVDYCGGEERTKSDVKMVVRSVLDANYTDWHDLSEDFPRNLYAEKISDALAEFLGLED